MEAAASLLTSCVMSKECWTTVIPTLNVDKWILRGRFPLRIPQCNNVFSSFIATYVQTSSFSVSDLVPCSEVYLRSFHQSVLKEHEVDQQQRLIYSHSQVTVSHEEGTQKPPMMEGPGGTTRA